MMRERLDEIIKQCREQEHKSDTCNHLELYRLLDADGIIQCVSDTHECILGYQPKELAGRRVFDLIHPDDELPVRIMFDVMVHKNSVFNSEYRIRHINGSWIKLHGKATPVIFNGQPMGFLSTSTCVSDTALQRVATKIARLCYALNVTPDEITTKEDIVAPLSSISHATQHDFY